MSRKAKILNLLILFLGMAGVVVAVVPGSVFQLDGDSVAAGGDDWNLLNGTTGSNGAAGNSIVRTFVTSENPPRIFTQGGSKDPLDTTSWKWKEADTVPDKDTITNGYAALYNGAGNHQILVFGAERFANNGDANIGLWFFQKNIGPQNDFTFGPDQHQNGDIFAVSAFTGGGSNPVISVYKWLSSCTKDAGKNLVPVFVNGNPTNSGPDTCAAANLQLQFASVAGSSCATGDLACAATNPNAINVSWPYAAKFGGAANVVPSNAFFEGGIDITELSGGTPGSEPCLSSILIETRSSAEPSSTLKDFIHGSFNTCGEITVQKDCNCSGITADGNNFQYKVSGSVHNTSPFSPLYDVTVSISGLTCSIGQVAAGATVAWGDGTAKPCSPSNTFNSTQKPPSNEATVTWARTSGGPTFGPNTSGSTACGTSSAACVINPQLLVDKVCTVATEVVSGRIELRVDFSGTVTNNTTNAPLHNVKVEEDHDQTCPPGAFTVDQTFNIGDLAVGQTKTFSGSYYPSNVCVATPGRLQFSDTVKASGDSTLGGSATPQTWTATCLLCPPGSAACPAP